MFGRRITGALVTTLVLGAYIAAPLAHAASGTKIYRNTAAGYTMSYPATWSLQRSAEGNAFFAPPDKNALIGISSVALHPTAAQIKKVEMDAANSIGKIQGRVTAGPQALGGITYQAVEATIKTSDGSLVNFLALDVVHGKYNNLFSAVVALKTHTSDAETRQVVDALSSISFK
jgi:hypothetical protein